MVDLNVIGMAVPAGPVVPDDNIGRFRFEDRDQFGRDVVDLRVGESVLTRTNHCIASQTRIRIAQLVECRNPERAAGSRELRLAGSGDITVGCDLLGNQTSGAVRRHDEHHPVPVCAQPSHGARGEKGLIIGMRVNKDNRRHVCQSGAQVAIEV